MARGGGWKQTRNPVCQRRTHDIEFADGVCRVSDFRLEWSEITSGGVAVCPADSAFKLRPATKEEAAAFKRAIGLAPPADDFTFAFLIKVDRVKLGPVRLATL